ncbi:BPTI/Kunitz domain-containing protein-like [Latimeria chalumnae]|uniref:BPTI/Kunitz domain-containing protein-like n=1 Tax=Latimeria chalumnae TaxID=7897 RepID=UPI00313C5605
MDHGTRCRDYQQMWYYNKDIDACALFWYGGCGGNENRFNTENECLQACTSKNACAMKQEQGTCQNYVLRWYYNSGQNNCSQFWYGGCGGNKNRFGTRQECVSLCVKSF